MTDNDTTQSDRFKEFAGEWRKRLVEGVAQVYGGKAVDAVDLSPDEEVRLWRKPTSPAALRALEMGGSEEDAERANALWAHAMRGQQTITRQQLEQQGATPEQVTKALREQGLTDEDILATCRREAFNLAKANGKNSPTEEAKYHKKMAEKAAQSRARMVGIVSSSQSMTGEETTYHAVGKGEPLP